MELPAVIRPGLTKQTRIYISEEHSASHVGSGSLRVLATPIMIAFMEKTARELLDENLPQGYSSVGIHIDLRHLAPTPVGADIQVYCEILEIDGKRINFSVKAWDRIETIGEGLHQRMVIEIDRFLRRVESKTNQLKELNP